MNNGPIQENNNHISSKSPIIDAKTDKKEFSSTPQTTSNTIPTSIDGLKQWYKDRNLPNENVTRFFIGKNYKWPKAFGIYQDEKTGNFIVYKNKASGERAIRYEGPSESYAVKEIYLKLKEEIAKQKTRLAEQNESKTKYDYNKVKKQEFRLMLSILGLFIAFCLAIVGISFSAPHRGYYHYNDSYYYYQNGSWYLYNDYSSGWEYVDIPKELKENHKDYYDSSYYNYYGIDRFEDSSYYVEPSSSSSSSSSSDWDSGSSWDSSSTDWDSDW